MFLSEHLGRVNAHAVGDYAPGTLLVVATGLIRHRAVPWNQFLLNGQVWHRVSNGGPLHPALAMTDEQLRDVRIEPDDPVNIAGPT
jgi:hypothetical protein